MLATGAINSASKTRKKYKRKAIAVPIKIEYV